MASFFIRRPIVAIVIAILTVIVGAITIALLPIAQFPNIAPPEIWLQANYPGADAKTLEQSVATPIEQQITGVDNMEYMYSVNTTNGSQTSLIVDFDLKTDPNTDLVLTQSRQQLANGQLPPEVTSYGISLRKSATAPFMLVGLYSPHGTRDAAFLSNYAYINLNDPIGRSYGVGRSEVFGAGQYAMRLWIKPDQLAKLGITVTDITNAIQAQNKVNPAGQIGGEPAQKNQQFTYALLAKGRLRSPEQFGNIVVRESPNGGTVRVKDVARVELGQQDYSTISRLNGKPTAIIAIYQLPGSNALQTAEGVRKLMAGMKDRLPEDVDYAISLDQTLPVSEGMREVVETLVIAILLVILVVYLFLQDWRATLIPMLAVPVSLVGTFALFPLFGFSINTLSMLGLVLAIGLVVDDAIVVVEGVQHHIEEGMAPKDAALKAMEELSGPVVGIALVLASVFVPTAFIPGITGRLYQQFALTIAISVILSAFNALTLSPALAGLLLRPQSEESSHRRRGPLGKFFDAFNRYWQRSTDGFVRWSHAVIRKGGLVMVLLVLFGLGAFFFGNRLPSSFMPDEDQGYLYVSMQLPIAASMERTSEAGKQVENVLANIPGVQYTTSVIGFNLLSFAHTSYNGFFFVTLKPWGDRKSRAEQYQEIKTRLNQELSRLPQGTVFGFSPPAVPGVGTSGGFQFVLEDRAGKDVKFLSDNLNKFLVAARKRPEIGMISSTFIPSVPEQYINVDEDKVLKQGVAISDVYQTIQAYMGGLFVNYFNDFGRTWQVYIEAEAPYRANTQNLSQFYVRNNQGQNVPLSSLANFETDYGPEFTLRYNEYRAAQIFGSAAPGYSSQQATAALEDVFHQTMPHEMGFDYMGMSYQEQKARQGVPAWAIFALSLLFVFLILAALYESWTLPFSVLLSTPVAVFGALAALWLRRFVIGLYMPPYMVQMENDVYTQIGLVMLIGLGAKNSILIVAFAKEDYERGMSLVDAALSAARLRFRPLMMTALAFIVGCVPLWIASGAGSVARQIIGTTVIGGMLAETFIGRFFVPAIFYVVEKFSGAEKRKALPLAPAEAPSLGD
ncbi:MAG: hydrophobe/amphiphile efflux-1 family RND transporter [Verrucomicrobia bacterium]|jgi:HAE1 family hydrophobic/amphiphilic exporter-1|nr:MAG: hydrophobe/amphiphile efflux-1 family RND transporter [Verrucomicrobiota bacterium]